MSGAVLHIVGMGPGDPELITLKAARVLADCEVVAHFAKRGRPGHARSAAAAHLPGGVRELRLDYPYTTEVAVDDPSYLDGLAVFYDDAATRIAGELALGRRVVLLCEGDPFFYGSAMYVHDRLARDYTTVIVPGVTGMSGCWTRAGLPMVHGDDVLSVLPGTLDEPTLAARLAATDAAVVMKLGRNLAKVRAALASAGRLKHAMYVERGTMAGERIIALDDKDDDAAPYFSLILVPGRRRRR
ncbi:precorrin-2 C(20)-methyltransferase [Acidisphaera rubrifaciens]|uniref:Precorrin-2 C20-methyltransferase n=1 Tax=Acidisphaera rubrifaciens HS-AP3 TaxID=1231350 RepID=A0A0D6P6K3_9PROT|nr:precorrin-2 C(20)-methyltransferase [Acidisphaera rubrifaciens]GAN76828.1 precorrin-2 C20-methyltransferase [Acidisphaera rubrifaciens HS-AP3]